jgi:hypothetical protein
MKLEKRIPVGGGLGGGSSNAAAMLRGIVELFDLEVPHADLVEIARSLGSDVPFLLRGGSAIVEGLGERLEHHDHLPDVHAVLAFPAAACPTGAIYGKFDLMRPDAALQSARGTRGDGRIEAAAIRHEPRAPLGACAMPDGTTMLRLRTLAGDVERVRVAVDGVDWVGLAEEPTRGAFAWWSGTVRAPRGAAYTFLLSDGTMTVRDPMTYSLAPTPAFTTPEWAKHAIWYQVFPERFRNGDPSNDPQPVRPWRSAWYEPSEWEGKDGQTFFNHFVFSRKYGGDLQGLRWALPYLKSLGVNAIYLDHAASTPLDPQVIAALQAALTGEAAAGNLTRTRRLIDQLVRRAPQSPEAAAAAKQTHAGSSTDICPAPAIAEHHGLVRARIHPQPC